mmetsp:Transcript_28209/g.95028  ORF Transcript_28209/g.95028 Transcript_28209/m.95028 type:complete len:206 (-) Transcript_28209:416-1033(-)
MTRAEAGMTRAEAERTRTSASKALVLWRFGPRRLGGEPVAARLCRPRRAGEAVPQQLGRVALRNEAEPLCARVVHERPRELVAADVAALRDTYAPARVLLFLRFLFKRLDERRPSAAAALVARRVRADEEEVLPGQRHGPKQLGFVRSVRPFERFCKRGELRLAHAPQRAWPVARVDCDVAGGVAGLGVANPAAALLAHVDHRHG